MILIDQFLSNLFKPICWFKKVIIRKVAYKANYKQKIEIK